MPVPLVEMRGIEVAFGGVRAVDGVTIDLHAGEVVALVGGNGAGKSTLIRALSGAHPPDAGEILVDGERVAISNPREAKALGIEAIYQTLALADNADAASNLFLGRELLTRTGALDDAAMEAAARRVIGRLNPNFTNFKAPVQSLSGGQRQSVAIARAVHFNARILIMDEPTAALGPAETEQVRDLVVQLKEEGIGIFLISHDVHDVFDLADRISVMHQGRLVGTVSSGEVSKDDVLAMIIMGTPPPSGRDSTSNGGAAARPMSRLRRPVVIVGMMAAGKTTLGRAVADALGVGYHDSDEAIESTVGGNGRALAEGRGVDWLHALEADVLARQLDEREPGVISAAASVVDDEASRRLLAERATVCWVDVPIPVLEERINHDDHRRPMARDELHRRYESRVPLLDAMADVRIDGLAPLDEQVRSVIAALAEDGHRGAR